MYSGTTIGKSSGKFLGAHQKIDRVARRALEASWPSVSFPGIRDILQFEGQNGPDALKRKSPARDEPWHYFNPKDARDTQLLAAIDSHQEHLVGALQAHNAERAAFEAAWLAHALIDGLTPAHHYPLQEELEVLRGESIQTRRTIKDKLIIRRRGDTGRQMLMKNWRYWGAKGIMTTHGLFEWGVATTIAPLQLKSGYPSSEDLAAIRKDGIVKLFVAVAQEIYNLDMYERFHKQGWTRRLATEVRRDLAPRLVKLVALAWYEAALKAYGDSLQ